MKKDIAVFQFDDPNSSLTSRSFGNKTSYVTSQRSLAQRFLILMYTSLGEDLIDSEAGGELGTMVGGNITFEAEVENIFQSAVVNAERIVKEDQLSQILEDKEKLKNAELKSIILSGDIITATMNLYTYADELSIVKLSLKV